MTKNELRTGDIIVTEAGNIGVVLKDEGYILYQNSGLDWMDDFKDDLKYDDPACKKSDIIKVYRGCTFIDLDESVPEWERDENNQSEEQTESITVRC